VVDKALVESTISNAKGLTGILNEQAAGSLAMKYQGFYDESSDDAYKSAASAITNVQKVSKDIESDPDAYFEKRLEGIDEDSKKFYSLLRDEILEADMRSSQEQAVESMRSYSSPQDYLAENLSTANRLSEAYQTEFKKFQEQKQEALEKKAEELGRMPTRYEMAEINEQFAEQEKEMKDKYKQNIQAVQAFPKMMGEVMAYAYGTMKQKKDDEANKSQDSSGGSE